MAGTFNKKQEVLDFILTREGEKLYSEGGFKPAYYEFYDGDIIYEADNSELQNATKERIVNGVYSKPISAIDQISALGGTITNDNSNLLKNPMGTYQVLNQNAPSWNISFKEAGYSTGSFSTTQKDVYESDINGNSPAVAGTLKGVDTYEERIPQFNINIKYRLYLNEIALANDKFKYELYLDNDNNDVLLALEEKNAFELNENPEFEIEVFEIIEPKGEAQTQYTLERRYFDFENFEDKESVEKYFNILVDEETKLESNFKKKNIYKDILADPEEACEPEETI